MPTSNVKLILYGIGNVDTFTYCTVEKSQNFFTWFSELTRAVFTYPCFDDWEEKQEKDGTCIQVPKKISNYTDRHEQCGDSKSNTRFDLFYGKDRIFIIMHSTDAVWQQFMHALEERTKKM